MENKKTKLKDYRLSQKKTHEIEVAEAINETYTNRSQLSHYNQIKRIKWSSWLIVLTIVVIGAGLTWLVGYLAINSEKAPNWQATGWFSLAYTSVIFLIYWVIGFVRNKEAAKFFNDRRRRYQRTIQDWEAKIYLTKKILLLSFIPMLIITIVTNLIY
ncbi:hypothetical protein ESOMN_v1c05100 [Williamsoniiplasma somnilux]|uniref:Uncharacterized protein n=1 Tax=Williamsoniiplasma somnilux TaxID=215578 RepID=A0A2K8NYH9_9MOLU|nr:hypothetical protein [Williamsoniiplasma somnilux]ATZ18892.1 hypothetical protein ESOMN_v1c05100 [Williamsoniiplasma somnilux]